MRPKMIKPGNGEGYIPMFQIANLKWDSYRLVGNLKARLGFKNNARVVESALEALCEKEGLDARAMSRGTY